MALRIIYIVNKIKNKSDKKFLSDEINDYIIKVIVILSFDFILYFFQFLLVYCKYEKDFDLIKVPLENRNREINPNPNQEIINPNQNPIQERINQNPQQEGINSEILRLNGNPFPLRFKSGDNLIDYSIICNRSQLFVDIEKKLYEEYPNYKETQNYFLCNANVIKRFKTIGENNLRDNDVLILNLYD